MAKWLIPYGLPLIVGSLLVLLFSYFYNGAWQQGYAVAQSEQRALDLAKLEQQIQASQQLLEQAQATSQALNQAINSRRQSDAQTTQEIRHALSLTAEQRRACTYDADSLQHLHTAYQRALQAVASGLAHPMSTAGGHDE